MTRVLKMKFRDSFGKGHYFNIPYVKDNLTKEIVYQQMKDLAKTKLFAKDGASMLKMPLSADLISTTTETITNEDDFGVGIE